jgi:DNA-binding transcriptional LysR family regulator
LNLRFLETFVWVARLKSFSLTAEKLNTTQAAVSHRIATLESQLGTRLFERDLREVRLTRQGVDALEYAERLVRLAGELRQRFSNPSDLSGTVRIGVIDTIAQTWLTQLIERASHGYPSIVLELHADQSVDIARQLQANELDLGLMMGPVTGPGVVNVDLCTYASVWVASPKLDISAAPLAISDLARYPILSFPRESTPHREMLAYFRRPRRLELRLHTSNSLSTLIRLAIDGIGLAAIPATCIQREIQSGLLQVIEVPAAFPPLPLHAVFIESGTRPLPALLADMAREIARDFCANVDPKIAW